MFLVRGEVISKWYLRGLCFVLCGLAICSGQPAPECSEAGKIVDLHLLKEDGSEIPFQVASVVPERFITEGGAARRKLSMLGFDPVVPGTPYLRLPPDDYVVEVKYFSTKIAKVKLTVYTSCYQRATFIIERPQRPGSIGDFEHERVVGTLTGCKFDRRWWVRIVGVSRELSKGFEGSVTASGKFEIPGGFPEGPYIIVAGFNLSVIKSGVFIVEPKLGTYDVGTIVLTSCAEEKGASARAER